MFIKVNAEDSDVTNAVSIHIKIVWDMTPCCLSDAGHWVRDMF
jgi:hypothetical protein